MKNLFRLISALLILVVVVGLFPNSMSKVKASSSSEGVDDFVSRCYRIALQREPDLEGFNFWKSKVVNGELVASSVVYEFIFSKEYTEQNKDDEEFVNDLYTMFMGRPYDIEGYNYWKSQLDSGKSRKDVFSGFANSQEFYELCVGYGITSGYYTDEYDLGKVNAVNLFVERLYKTCLGRIGDKEGQKYWVEGLLKGQLTGVSCASNYIKSSEYEALGLTDEQYVENLYIAFMGRRYDESGKANWLNHLTNGTKTRDQVFEGFANSEEFNSICNNYGIVCGNYKATDLANSTPASESDSIPTTVEVFNDDEGYRYEVYYDANLFELVNAYRVENGINKLKWNGKEQVVVKERIVTMAKEGVVSHDVAGGPPSNCCAENLYWGTDASASFIFNGYKSSPGHDVNMKKESATSCVFVTVKVTKNIGGLDMNAGVWNIQVYY